MTNAEAIVSELARLGVGRVFGVPGGEVTLLLDACRRAGIPFYSVGHEASAAFMAATTGQLAGIPGACLATVGPGAVNLGIGVAHALLDRAPMVALTAQVPVPLMPHFSHQRLPLDRFFGSLCKWSVTLDGRQTVEAVWQAAAVATAPPPGPVHVALPSDLAGDRPRPGLGAAGWPQGEPAGGASASLGDVAGLLARAHRPLVVVGLGCTPCDVPVLRTFVDRTGIPYVVTPKAKGTLPEDTPGFLGVVGGMAIDSAVMANVDEAGFLLGVGFDPVECDKDWYLGRPMACLGRWPTAEGAYRPVEVVGDIATSLAGLAGSAGPVRWPADLLARCRERIRPSPLPPRDGLSPLESLRALREVAPPETILACDVGSHKYFAGQFWPCRDPQTFLVSNGLSGMGYGLPAAIAAKLHAPRRPVLALLGDGGLLMSLHALTCMRQHRIPVAVIVFVDGSLSLIRIAQQRRGVEPYGVEFPPPDFAAVARGFGVEGVAVRSLDELKRAVDGFLRDEAPLVISVPVDVREYEAYC